MGRCICYVTDKEKQYYFLWSTIVDAPITFGMELDEFMDFMKEEYGNQGWDGLNESLERARKHGTSWASENYPLDRMINNNRAGKNETTLTKEQIVEWYCRRRENPQ
jgi:hypothetical protein